MLLHADPVYVNLAKPVEKNGRCGEKTQVPIDPCGENDLTEDEYIHDVYMGAGTV